MNMRRIMVSIVLIISIVASGYTANVNLVRSIIFPGMGQIGAGKPAHTARGLLYMGVEVACLTLMFTNFSKSTSYARNTEYLEIEYDLADTYEERQSIFDDWTEAYDLADSKKMQGAIFGGAAGLMWIINVVDALVFVPNDDARSELYRNIKENTTLNFSLDKAAVSYNLKF